jgi:large subunit ribosomal protein L9
MKVILLEDVSKVGQRYEVVDVAPGYARNFLFAKGVAEAVTKSNAKRVADLGKKRDVEKKRQDELLEKAFAGVSDAVVTLSREASEEGSLYAGVTKEDVAEELGKMLGAPFAAQHIDMAKSIKTLGEHKITVDLGGKQAQFVVKVEGAA